jgi:hypothetical protein
VQPPPLRTVEVRRIEAHEWSVAAIVLLAVGLVAVVIWAALLPGRIRRDPRVASRIELAYGPVIPDSVYVRYLHASDSETIIAGLSTLRERNDPAGVNRAVELLGSSDDFVWLNAALYVGECGRQEAVPFLIKALRHYVWRTDEEALSLLRQLTGEDFGSDFPAWQQWWLSREPDSAIDWESDLGPVPRLPKEPARPKRESPPAQ